MDYIVTCGMDDMLKVFGIERHPSNPKIIKMVTLKTVAEVWHLNDTDKSYFDPLIPKLKSFVIFLGRSCFFVIFLNILCSVSRANPRRLV